jgi:broad specificity phosphatase PhoE
MGSHSVVCEMEMSPSPGKSKNMEVLSTNLSKLIQGGRGSRVVLIRHGESVVNLAGVVAGWMDSKLTDLGRRQAHMLYAGLHPHLPMVKAVYSSDLKRAMDTMKYATLWTTPYTIDERLRENYFGDHENEHFDSWTQEMKDDLNSINYAAPNGESWVQTRERAMNFLKENIKEDGVHLCFTHGGLMCSLTYEFGIKDILPNCSAVAFTLEDGKLKGLEFSWLFPELITQ